MFDKGITSGTVVMFLYLLASLQAQDTTPATIDSVTSTTNDGTYGPGSQIDITISFSENVTLLGGTLKIFLITGVANRFVEIFSISDTTSASGAYTVQAGDLSSDLSVSSITIEGSGATLKDTEDNLAVLSIPSGRNLNDLKDISIDAVPPDPPEGLTTFASDGIATLEWNKNSESDVSKYRIFAGTSANPTILLDSTTAITDTTKTFTNLANDTTYYFRLTAVDFLGNESGYSDDKSATPFSPPIAGNIRDGLSTDIDWTNSSNSLSANWDMFEDNGSVTYEYAIGVSAIDDIANWTYIGSDTSVIDSNLILVEHFTYKMSVRGTDYTLASDIATTDGVTIDFTSPSIGTVNDGLSIDITFTVSDTALSANWRGFSDDSSGINYYEYAIGDSAGGSNVANWTNAGMDTFATNSDTTFHNAVTYYFSVRAVDNAGNISDVATSNGITIDTSAPIPGTIFDGLVGDTEWTTDTTILSASWYGFSDELSGIESYEYAIGSDSGDTDVVDWTNIGTDSSVTRTDLSLIDSTTYYFSVRATDKVGNVSSVVISNGITVDISPPSLISILPLIDTPLKLTENSDIVIIFSESVETLEVDLVSNIVSMVQYQVNHSDDQVTLTVEAPLASLDTITLRLRNVTDLRGLIADDMAHEFHTVLLADYNIDFKVDVEDLSEFVSLWPGVDIGPVRGGIPHFIPDLDGETDLRDGMVFARMWRWSYGQEDTLVLARPFVGEEVEISQSDQNLIIVVPEEVSAGRVILKYPQSKTNINVATEELTSERILLRKKEEEQGQIIVDFGYLEDKDRKEVIFDIEHHDRSNSSIILSYIFYSGDKNIVAMGFRLLDLKAIPRGFALYQNYPNPFNPNTTILYDLPGDTRVTLIIYDILGREVRTLIDENIVAGYHSVIWDGKDEVGQYVSTGIYIYRIHARGIDGGSYSKNHKMLLLK